MMNKSMSSVDSYTKFFLGGCIPAGIAQNAHLKEVCADVQSKGVTAPTWQEMVYLILNKKLTSSVLEAYVRARMDLRVVSWRNAYKEWQNRWGNDTHTGGEAYKQLCEIPLYILHNEHILQTLLSATFVFSDEDGKSFYCENQGRSVHSWQSMLDYSNGNVAHGRFLSALYIQDYIKNSTPKNDMYETHFPYHVLATIEHEITHCEQAVNGRTVMRLVGSSTKTIILMTNKGAHECIKRFKDKNLKQLRSSNAFSMESEAETRAIQFHPNLCGLCAVAGERKKLGLESDEKEGYFSNERFIALSTALLPMRHHDFFEYYYCMTPMRDSADVEKNMKYMGGFLSC